MGDGKEIEVGGKVIGENTKISLSVKTALWIIGGVIVLFSTAFTTMYFKVEADMQTYKEKTEQANKDFIKEIESNLNTKLDKQENKNDRFIEEMTQMRLNIQQLLDRTQGIQTNTGSSDQTIHNNSPDKIVPENHSH